MKEKLTKTLHKTYPEIFTPMFNNYPVGFECNDGWFVLINDLCEELMAMCNTIGQIPPQASQVKEKYGTLRFYTWTLSTEASDIISKYETKSQYICETCGIRGQTYKHRGWFSTLCTIHHAEWIKPK